QRGDDRVPSQVGGLERREGSGELADGRAGGRDDDRTGHDNPRRLGEFPWMVPSPAMSELSAIRAAIVDGAPARELGDLPLPASYRGAVVRADEQEMFAGVASEDKDPRKSLHLDEVPLPELAPDEALVAVMASSINFNTV